MHFIRVDLPVPFGPIMQKNLTRLKREGDVPEYIPFSIPAELKIMS